VWSGHRISGGIGNGGGGTGKAAGGTGKAAGIGEGGGFNTVLDTEGGGKSGR